MNDRRDIAHRALKRMLANGRLTAVPKRPADQEILLALAASKFDARATYLESEVNELVGTWLETISEPFGIDHVTFRRMLVDSGLLVRTRSGSTYGIDPEKAGPLEVLRDVDVAGVLSGIKADRDQRRRERVA
jgi:hypothetical protein